MWAWICFSEFWCFFGNEIDSKFSFIFILLYKKNYDLIKPWLEIETEP